MAPAVKPRCFPYRNSFCCGNMYKQKRHVYVRPPPKPPDSHSEAHTEVFSILSDVPRKKTTCKHPQSDSSDELSVEVNSLSFQSSPPIMSSTLKKISAGYIINSGKHIALLVCSLLLMFLSVVDPYPILSDVPRKKTTCTFITPATPPDVLDSYPPMWEWLG